MAFIKQYFLTVNALLVFLVLAIAFVLQGQLAYVYRLEYAESIVYLLAKIDQVSFILLIGMALALSALYLIVYRIQRINALFLGVTALLFVTLCSKGKFENLGLDSVGEVLTTNWQEAMDFAAAHLLHARLSIKEALLVLVPLVLVPIYRSISRGLHERLQARDIRLAFAVVGGVYLLAAGSFGIKLWVSYHGIDVYRQSLERSTMAALAGTLPAREAPNIVVYIGESTDKDALGLNRPMPNDHPLRPVRDDLIVFGDVVTPFSHTFPALYRALSLARDPYLDQFRLDSELERANSIALLNHAGFETHWLSNQNIGCSLDWTSQLFGQRAAHASFLNVGDSAGCPEERRYDGELIAAFEAGAAQLERPRQAMFLHSYAGHADYCKNIPPQARAPAAGPVHALPPRAVFGGMYIHDIRAHREAIACYESAVRYVAANLRRVVDRVAAIDAPVVLVYFSDHGEDVYAGTGHDSRKNSFRHIEIPFFVYFNPAARERFPELAQAARDNRERRYSLEWLTDSMLDLAGVDTPGRAPVSIFSPGLDAPPRYALRRADIRGNQLILAVDEEDQALRHGLINHGHDYFRKRRILHTVAATERDKLCAAHANTLLKFAEAASIFSCAEIDVTLDAELGTLYAYPPLRGPQRLPLEHLIAAGRARDLVLSLRNIDQHNVAALAPLLNRIIPENGRRTVTLRLPLFSGAEPAHLRELAAAGYRMYVDLPSYRAARCVMAPARAVCTQLARELADVLERFPFAGVSFEAGAWPFIDSLRLHDRVDLHVRDDDVKGNGDLAAAPLASSRRYTIPYASAFNP